MIRKFKITLLGIFSLVSFLASAQMSLYVKTIGGGYNMKNLKQYQQQLARNYSDNGNSTKVTSEFPFSFQAEIGLDFERKSGLTFGPWINYIKTKGELIYSNNGAQTTITNDLTRLGFGIKLSKNFYRNFAIYGKVGVNATILDVGSSGTSHTPLVKDLDYLSNGGTAELGCLWRITRNRFSLSTNLGYEAGFNGTLAERGQPTSSQTKLYDSEGSSVKVNWNGLRLGIGLGFDLIKPAKSITPKTIEVD
jgi:hypothetical protein